MFCQVNISTHFKIAATLWILVGCMLLFRGLLFIYPLPLWHFGFYLLGLITGYFWFARLFARIVYKNISRLEKQRPKSIWAFQSGKSYLIIAFMISLGITLRRLGVNKTLLAFIYANVGISLLKASQIYFKKLKILK